jgi:hypothetical protein
MVAEVRSSPRKDAIVQFSVFSDNKVGRLNELVHRFAAADLHIIAISQLDSTECTIMRFIVDYPEVARETLRKHNYAFSEHNVLGVEIATEADLKVVTSALLEAEVNIHYLYPFVVRPNGMTGLAVSLDDLSFAEQALAVRGVRCLSHRDIAR